MAEVIDLSEATKVADVVPLWDTQMHDVPGGYLGHSKGGYGSPDEWLALDTAEHLRDRQCPCCPSVRTQREGAHIGVVVVHHAFDGRTSGSSA